MKNESVITSVSSKIASQEGVKTTELSPPLHAAVDPDALEALFSDSIAGDSQEEIHVEFSYAGYEVTIERKEDVRISVE